MSLLTGCLRFTAISLLFFAVGLLLIDEKTITTTNRAISSIAAKHSRRGNHEDDTAIVIPLSGKLDSIPHHRVLSAINASYRNMNLIDDINNITTASKMEFSIELPYFDSITNSLIPKPCYATSKMKILRHDEDGAADYWTLISFGPDGHPKQVGGDEYYITFYQPGKRDGPLAIGNVTDHNNGTYHITFVQSPTAGAATSWTDSTNNNNTGVVGNLEVILEQTCGIGSLPPPLKQNWSVSGAINQFYVVPNVTAPTVIHPFIPPNVDRSVDLNQYDQVLVLGDSLLGQFVCAENDRPSLEHCAPFRPKIQKFNIIQAALHNDTWQSPFMARVRQDVAQLNLWLKAVQQQQQSTIPRVPRLALVIGSGVWDILADDTSLGGVDFTYHLQACRNLIESIRREFPTLDVYWKSMTAMHIHKVAEGNPVWATVQRSYYMSTSRAHRLYLLQNKLMATLGIPVLDVYPGTFFAAHMARFADGRHYQPAWNAMSLNWFYPPPLPPPSPTNNVTDSTTSEEETHR